MSLDIYGFSRLKPISRVSKEVNYGQSSHEKHLKKKPKHIFSFGYISAKKKGCSMVQGVDEVSVEVLPCREDLGKMYM